MKTIAILFLSVLYIIPAQAQYCSTKKDRIAYYETTDHKSGKTLRDTTRIADMVDGDDYQIIKEETSKNQYNSRSIKDGSTTNFYLYLHHKNKDITDVIMLDGTMENNAAENGIYAQFSPDQQKEAEHEYKKYSKYIYSNGRISVPLRENVRDGEEIPSSNYYKKIGGTKVKIYLKGEYKGHERIHTSAGDFDCIKIHTKLKGKAMLFSDSEYTMSWYAKNIGLVKSETLTKRGKVLSTTLLSAIKE